MYLILTKLVLIQTIVLFVKAFPHGDGGTCTEGFVTADGIDAARNNVGTRVVGEPLQGIYPEVGFTCDGTLQQWIFGTTLTQESINRRPQLQIWRPSSGGYSLVANTTVELINISQNIQYYNLSSPIPFQPGDVIGYSIPNNPLFRFYFEKRTDIKCASFNSVPSEEAFFSISSTALDCRFHLLVDVVTDPPGCGYGFISTERMRYVLNNNSVPSTTTSIDQRQQISPDMRFTCDGFITKWIIDAEYIYGTNSLYPELQIWRNIENSTVYEKISGVSIAMPLRQFSGVYEFDNFPPIAVKSGDIVGISIPDRSSSRLQLLSEITNAPIQYYIPINPSSSSSYDVIDIQSSLVTSSAYRPLVSVEFVRVAPSIFKDTHSTSTNMVKPTTSSTSDINTSTDSRVSLGVCIGAGTGIAFFLLLTSSLIIVILIFVIIALKRKEIKKRNSMNISSNPAYATSFHVEDNIAYATTLTDTAKSSNEGESQDNNFYDTVTTTDRNNGCDTSDS